MRNQKFIWASTLLLLAGAGFLRMSAHARSSAVQVTIDNYTYGPDSLTVPVGTTVTWTNRDDIPHTVVSTDGVFRSRARDTDETFSYTFDKTGTYPYYCSVHPKMTGKVIVK